MMRKTLPLICSVLVLAASAFAQTQSAPTLRVVTEDPTLPSDLFYGDIKVKPLRLRPGTNTRITIDDRDFFVQQHYIDFLSRFPEAGGFNSWLNVFTRCNSGDAACIQDLRLTVSASFFQSQEFQLKGYFVYRFYKASLGRLPLYNEIVGDMRNVTGTTSEETLAKRDAFVTNWVARNDFRAIYDGLSNAAYVDRLLSTAAITLPNRDQLVADLNSSPQRQTRAQVLRAIVESEQFFNKEYNPAFVAMQYFGYLRRDPEAAGYNAWLTYLNAHPTDYREMVRGFVDSLEYRNRF